MKVRRQTLISQAIYLIGADDVKTWSEIRPHFDDKYCNQEINWKFIGIRIKHN